MNQSELISKIRKFADSNMTCNSGGYCGNTEEIRGFLREFEREQ